VELPVGTFDSEGAGVDTQGEAGTKLFSICDPGALGGQSWTSNCRHSESLWGGVDICDDGGATVTAHYIRLWATDHGEFQSLVAALRDGLCGVQCGRTTYSHVLVEPVGAPPACI